MIRLLLVDDQTLLRQGIRSLLELGETPIQVRELADGEHVLKTLKSASFDVILLDIQMPNKDGIAVLEELKQEGISTPVIVLTTFNDDANLLRCAELGAKSFMLKDSGKAQLLATIEKVVAGETLIHQAVTERVLQGFNKTKAVPVLDIEPLTSRETDVLRFMSGGYSNKEIGKAVHLSEGTVKNHVSNILAKLGVRDRTRAIIKAMEFGLLE